MPLSVHSQPVPFPYVGEIASLMAAAIWAVSMSLYRHFGRDLPSDSLNLFRSLVAIACSCIAVVVLRPEFPTGLGNLGAAGHFGDCGIGDWRHRLLCRAPAAGSAGGGGHPVSIAANDSRHRGSFHPGESESVSMGRNIAHGNRRGGSRLLREKGILASQSAPRRVLAGGVVFAVLAALANAADW